MEPLLRALVKHDNITMGTKQQLTASTVPTMADIIYYEQDTGRKKTGNGTSTYSQLPYDSGFGVDASLTLTLYGNGSPGDVVAFRIPGIIERVTLAAANAARWVGVLRTGGSDGQDVVVDVFGSVNDKLSNLSAGADYYLNNDGSLTTQVTSNFVGRALTDKALIIMNSGAGSLNSTNAPNRPSNISPANNATNVAIYPTLTSSAFSSVNDTHDKSRWQVSTSASFATIAYDSGESSDLITHSVPSSSGLLPNTTYYWGVFHKGVNGGWSERSLATSYQSGNNTDDFIFTTPGNTTWTVPQGMFFGDSAVIPDQSASSFATFLSGTSTAVIPEFTNVALTNFPSTPNFHLANGISCNDGLRYIYYTSGTDGAKVYKFDTTTGSSTQLGNAPYSTADGKAVVAMHYVNDTTLLFVVSGSSTNGLVISWNPVTATEIKNVNMTTKCVGTSSALSADKTMLYVYGGYDSALTSRLADVYRISHFLASDQAAMASAAVANLAYPQAYGSATLIPEDDYHIVLGGEGAVPGSRFTDRVHVYNALTGAFISSNVLPYYVDSAYVKTVYHQPTKSLFVIGPKYSKDTQSNITDLSRDYVSVIDLSGSYSTGGIQDAFRYKNFLKKQGSSLQTEQIYPEMSTGLGNNAYLFMWDTATQTTQKAYRFDMSTTAVWEEKPVNNLEYYSNHGLVVDDNDHLYAIGGLNGLSQSSTKMTRRLAGGDVWDYRAEMDTPRSGITPVRKNNKIHVVGGYNTLTSNPIASMEIYDTTLNSWANGPAFPATIHEYGSDIDADGNQWIVGGIFNNAPNNTAYYLDDTLQWVPASWGATNPVISGISSHAIAIIDNFMYIMGGDVRNVGVSARLVRAEIYLNTTTGKKDLRNFTNLADIPVQLRSFALSVDKVAGKFNVIGGDNASGNSTYHFEYTVSSNSWKSITSFPIPVRDMAAVRDSSGKIITVGGNTSSGGTVSRAYVYEFNNVGFDFAGEDEILQGQGFTFNDPDLIATPGPYGTSSKIAGIRRSIPLTPGDVHQLTIGSPAGGIRIKKSQQAGPSGQAEYTTAGTVTFTVPNLVNFIHALIVPNVAVARLGTLLTSVSISSSVNTQVNTYTTSQTVNIPAGATNIRLVGKGSNGTAGSNGAWNLTSVTSNGTPLNLPVAGIPATMGAGDPQTWPATLDYSGMTLTRSGSTYSGTRQNLTGWIVNASAGFGNNNLPSTLPTSATGSQPFSIGTVYLSADQTTSTTVEAVPPWQVGSQPTIQTNPNASEVNISVTANNVQETIVVTYNQNSTPPTNGTASTAVINGQTYTFPGGTAGPASNTTFNIPVINGNITSMQLTIPSGGQIVAEVIVNATTSNTYLSNTTVNIPAGVTQVKFTGKGQDGSPGTPGTGGDPIYQQQVAEVYSNETGPFVGPCPVGIPYNSGFNGTDFTWQCVRLENVIIGYTPVVGGSPATTGSSATALLNGQTYTFPGGNGTTAQPTTFTVNLSGATTLPLQMVIPSGAQIVVETTSSAWAPVANLTAARSLHASTCDKDGKVYVFGGVDITDAYLTTAEVYDPDAESWTAIAAMPQARTKFKAIYDGNDAIYLIGGENSTGRLSSVVKYTISSNSYSTVASLDIPLCNFAAVRDPVTGFIYVIGGESNTATAVNNIRRFKPALNQWEDQTWINNHSITTPKAQHDAAYSNGAIYIYGGVEAFGIVTNTGYKYLISSESVTPMSVTGATAVKNFTFSADKQHRLYRVGGYSGSSSLLTVDIYNPDDDAWAPTSSIPELRQLHSSATDDNGRIYIVGGNTASANKSASVIRYAPSNCFEFTNENGSASGNGFNISGNLMSPGSYGITSRQAAWRNNIPVTPGDQITVEVPTGGAVRIIWGSGKFFPDNAVI